MVLDPTISRVNIRLLKSFYTALEAPERHTVDLVILVYLDFREFVILGLLEV